MSHADPDRLVRHGALLAAAAAVAHLLNFGFHVVAGRLLPIGEYGALASVLGILALLGAPLTAVRMVVVHGAATDPATGGRELARWWIRRTLLLALASALAAVVLAATFARWFRLGSKATVWAAAAALLPLAVNPVVRGRIQGLQLFRWLAILGVVAAAFRLASGSLLMLVRPAAVSGVTATAAAAALSLGLGFVALRSSNSGESPPSDQRASPPLSLGATTLAVIGLAGLQQLDLVAIKRLADPDTAGLYAQASLLGRSLPYVTLPVANALLPKAAKLGLATDRGRRLFLLGMVLSLGSAAAAVAAFCLAPHAVLALVFGPDRATAELVALATFVVPAFAPLALTFPAVYAVLGGRHRGLRVILAGGAIALATGALVADGDPGRTAAAVAAVQTTVMLLLIGTVLVQRSIGGRDPRGR